MFRSCRILYVCRQARLTDDIPKLWSNFSIHRLNAHALPTDTKVGFVGLGNMGSHMAVNLARRGHNVHVYDISCERIAHVQNQVDSDCPGKIIPLHSLTDLVKSHTPPIVITMLPASPQVVEVFGSRDDKSSGLIALAPTKTLFIDCTTGDPEVARKTSEHALFYGCKYVDAPVSGGVLAAQNASLTFMVGGTEKAVASATPYLECMGKRVFHCGPVGTGLAAKICNNLLLAISMIGTSEAMELGRRLGLDPSKLAEVINNSSGRCWSSEVYNPVPGVVPNVPSSNNYTGGFGTALMAKDLGLAQTASTATGSPTPLGSIAHQLYRTLCQHDYAQKDFSSIYHFLTKYR